MKRLIVLFLTVLLLCSGQFALAKKPSLPGQLHIQTASPEEPTVTAVLCFPNLPYDYSRHASVRWYRDGVQINYTPDLRLCRNACAVCRVSVCFSEDTPEASTLTAVVTVDGKEYSFSGTLAIKNYNAAHYERLKTLAYPYRIEIGRKQNVVLIYAQDENGEYSLLQNAFLCSTGKPTPRGSFTCGDKFRWQALFGSEETNFEYVYGQYCTRITDNILFHSVPYYTKDASDLEYKQFNLLGTRVSQGCIRLCTENAKWIYDNCPVGTPVTMIDYSDLPVSLPTVPRIDPSDPRRGWDPTDPDPRNPWRPKS